MPLFPLSAPCPILSTRTEQNHQPAAAQHHQRRDPHTVIDPSKKQSRRSQQAAVIDAAGSQSHLEPKAFDSANGCGSTGSSGDQQDHHGAVSNRIFCQSSRQDQPGRYCRQHPRDPETHHRPKRQPHRDRYGCSGNFLIDCHRPLPFRFHAIPAQRKKEPGQISDPSRLGMYEITPGARWASVRRSEPGTCCGSP